MQSPHTKGGYITIYWDVATLHHWEQGKFSHKQLSAGIVSDSSQRWKVPFSINETLILTRYTVTQNSRTSVQVPVLMCHYRQEFQEQIWSC